MNSAVLAESKMFYSHAARAIEATGQLQVCIALRLAMCLFAVAVSCWLLMDSSPRADGADSASIFNVKDFGARGDGRTLDTKGLQDAIDACSARGGGQVLVPAGTFLTGPLRMKSHVELHLDTGAMILGSPHLADYLDGQNPPPSRKSRLPIPPNSNPRRPLAVLFGDNLDDISITGNGTINGSGGSPDFDRGDNDPFRPRILFFQNCRDVRISGVTLRDSAFWVQYYLGCRRVRIHGVHVYSHTNLNNDGLDIDASDVNVSDCIIDSDDDGICLKSDRKEPCENVTVSNCVVGSNCNAIKLGTDSVGGFVNIVFQNCAIRPASEHRQRAWKNTLSGIALEMVDGGTMDRVAISNITMNGVQTPIFIHLGDRTRLGKQRNIVISNVIAASDGPICASVSGLPNADSENIKLSHIIFECPGGGTIAMAGRTVPENVRGYPECNMFGPSLPAYGLYVRHVRNLTLDDVQFHLMQPDQRPAMAFDDVDQLRLSNIDMDTPASDTPPMRFAHTPGILVEGCRAGGKLMSCSR